MGGDAREHKPGGTHIWGRCDCQAGWFSHDCSLKYCAEHDGEMCNARGECDFDTGRCTCKYPYHSAYPGGPCELKYCPGTKPQVLGRNPGTRAIYSSDYIVCSGHGECMHETGPMAQNYVTRRENHASQGADGGWCNCEVGWMGPDCSRKQCPVHDGKVCNEQGECDPETGQCSCRFPYHSKHRQGGSCELKHCPGTKLAAIGRNPASRSLFAKDYIPCSGHGECMHETGPMAQRYVTRRENHASQGTDGGWCNCEVGWMGPDCSRKQCPVHDGKVCNEQGDCDPETGQCRCNKNFFGRICELRHCPDFFPKFGSNTPKRNLWTTDFVECSDHGTCSHNEGTCSCSSQYHGPACQLKQCPKSSDGFVCNGEGSCNEAAGECHCFEGLTGPACEETLCPFDNNKLECGGVERGDCNRLNGHCACKSGFSKYDCSW